MALGVTRSAVPSSVRNTNLPTPVGSVRFGRRRFAIDRLRAGLYVTSWLRTRHLPSHGTHEDVFVCERPATMLAEVRYSTSLSCIARY